MRPGWRDVPLGRVARGLGGGTPTPDNDAYWATTDSGTPWIAIADMSKRDRVSSTAKQTTPDGIKAARLNIGPPGTVLLAMYASIGEVAVLDIEATWNQALIGLVPDPNNLDGEYLAHALRATKGALLARAVSATQANIGAAHVLSHRIPLPPLPEQRAIAAYLDRETAEIDALVSEQVRLIETLRERRAAVVEEATIARPRSARVKHGADVMLGKMLDAGKAARDGDIITPYVRAADVLHNGSVNLDGLNTMPFSIDELGRLDLRAGDVLVIEGGATVGKPGYVDADVEGVAYQKTINRVRARPGESHGRYLFWTLSALYESGYYFQAYVTVSFIHLTAEKLREVQVPLPPLDEQRRIADYLDEQTSAIDALIAETERFIAVSKERRSALITAAVTGQIDCTSGSKI